MLIWLFSSVTDKLLCLLVGRGISSCFGEEGLELGFGVCIFFMMGLISLLNGIVLQAVGGEC